MADSVVCCAADAMDVTPRAARPGLIAALERVCMLEMTAEEVLRALAPAARDESKAQREP